MRTILLVHLCKHIYSFSLFYPYRIQLTQTASSFASVFILNTRSLSPNKSQISLSCSSTVGHITKLPSLVWIIRGEAPSSSFPVGIPAVVRVQSKVWIDVRSKVVCMWKLRIPCLASVAAHSHSNSTTIISLLHRSTTTVISVWDTSGDARSNSTICPTHIGVGSITPSSSNLSVRIATVIVIQSRIRVAFRSPNMTVGQLRIPPLAC